jgi:hypothetical protein
LFVSFKDITKEMRKIQSTYRDNDWYQQQDDENLIDMDQEAKSTTKHKMHKQGGQKNNKHHAIFKASGSDSDAAKNVTKMRTITHNTSTLGDLKDKRRHFYIPSRNTYSLGI